MLHLFFFCEKRRGMKKGEMSCYIEKEEKKKRRHTGSGGEGKRARTSYWRGEKEKEGSAFFVKVNGGEGLQCPKRSRFSISC